MSKEVLRQLNVTDLSARKKSEVKENKTNQENKENHRHGPTRENPHYGHQFCLPGKSLTVVGKTETN
jgi:hypothetical protein